MPGQGVQAAPLETDKAQDLQGSGQDQGVTSGLGAVPGRAAGQPRPSVAAAPHMEPPEALFHDISDVLMGVSPSRPRALPQQQQQQGVQGDAQQPIQSAMQRAQPESNTANIPSTGYAGPAGAEAGVPRAAAQAIAAPSHQKARAPRAASKAGVKRGRGGGVINKVQPQPQVVAGSGGISNGGSAGTNGVATAPHGSLEVALACGGREEMATGMEGVVRAEQKGGVEHDEGDEEGQVGAKRRRGAGGVRKSQARAGAGSKRRMGATREGTARVHSKAGAPAPEIVGEVGSGVGVSDQKKGVEGEGQEGVERGAGVAAEQGGGGRRAGLRARRGAMGGYNKSTERAENGAESEDSEYKADEGEDEEEEEWEEDSPVR